MMTLIRKILGKLILFLDAATTPRAMQRDPEVQVKVDAATSDMALYQFVTCPFCVKVRRAIRRLNLKIELREAKPGSPYAEELIKNGGMLQVPCLRVAAADGSVQWIYESNDIIAYLQGRFSE